MAESRSPLSVAEVRTLVARVPGMLAGSLPDTLGVRPAVRDAVAAVLLPLIREAFDLKSTGAVGPDGVKWPDNRPPKSPTAIGIDTTRLIESFDPASPDSVVRIEGGTIVIGTAVPWGKWFHDGVPERNQPARPMWPEELPPAWVDAIRSATSAAILERIAAGAAAGVRE